MGVNASPFLSRRKIMLPNMGVLLLLLQGTESLSFLGLDLPSLSTLTTGAASPALASQAMEQDGTMLHLRLDIGREEGKSTSMPPTWAVNSRLLVKDLHVKLTTATRTGGPALPGTDGPSPGSSSGARTVVVEEPGFYIGHGGATTVALSDGAWELVRRDEARAGALILGFTTPEECVRNDATLPSGRVYLSLPTWDREALLEMVERRVIAEGKASKATADKERAVEAMQKTENLLMKALMFREACQAMEALDFSNILALKSVPDLKDMLELEGGLLVCSTGTVWWKNPSLFGANHCLLGHCTVSTQDKGGFPIQDGRWSMTSSEGPF